MSAALRIEDFADDFNPFTALLTLGGEGHIHDLYPELARLRKIAPVHAIDLQSHLGAPKHVTIGDRPCYTILEGLRWNGPLCAINRTTTLDLTLGGVEIPKDAYLHVCIGAANRNEKIWPNPDKFDITRPRQRQMAFGYGPHVCIGQHLARN